MPNKEDFEFEIDPALASLEGFGLFGDMAPTEPGEDEAPWESEGGLFPDATARNQYEPLDPETTPQVEGVKQDTPEYAARPAKERTDELFAYMHPHRMALMKMLQAAQKPVDNAHMDKVAEAHRKQKFSVYSASNLCTMLEVAGALDRVLEDGTPYSQFQPEPEIVVIEGEEYYQPIKAPAVYWRITEAGQAVLDENDPAARLSELFEREADLLPIYKQVLMLAREGNSMATFSEKVDANPAIAEPRRFFVQHFVESLERCEALEWDGSQWVATAIGKQALETSLANVQAAKEFATSGKSEKIDGSVVPTETQGVNW